MKKMIAIAVALMLLPVGAFALEAITDTEMEAVTGQTGVSIAVDDVKIYQYIEWLTYTDDDGIVNLDPILPAPVPVGTGGMVGLQDLAAIMHMNGIVSMTTAEGADLMAGTQGADGIAGNADDPLRPDDVFTPFSPGRALQGTYVVGYDISNADLYDDTGTGIGAGAFGATDGYEETLIAKSLDIDVGVVPVLTAGVVANDLALTAGLGGFITGMGLDTTNVVGVQIGLPTLEICTSGLDVDIAVWDDTTVASGAHSANHGVSMGGVSIGNMTLTTLDGEIEIAGHSLSW
jgi:hypothetical protein